MDLMGGLRGIFMKYCVGEMYMFTNTLWGCICVLVCLFLKFSATPAYKSVCVMLCVGEPMC